LINSPEKTVNVAYIRVKNKIKFILDPKIRNSFLTEQNKKTKSAESKLLGNNYSIDKIKNTSMTSLAKAKLAFDLVALKELQIMRNSSGYTNIFYKLEHNGENLNGMTQEELEKIEEIQKILKNHIRFEQRNMYLSMFNE
jgi:hypothetical protein